MLVEVLEKVVKKRYRIKCLTQERGTATFKGYLVSEYQHKGEKFPVTWHPIKDRDKHAEEVEIKEYNSKKRAETFVEGRSGGMLTYYWDYEVEEFEVDETISSLGEFTGVVETNDLKLIRCGFGEHANAIRWFCWQHLMKEKYLTEEIFDENKAVILFFEDEFYDRVQLSRYLDQHYEIEKDLDCTFEMFREYLNYLVTTDDEVSVPKLWNKWHKKLDKYVMNELEMRTEYYNSGSGRYK